MVMGYFKENIKKYTVGGIITTFAGLTALGGYARIWEYRQPNQPIKNARVLSIEPYSSHNDLHWTSRGYRIRIDGEDRVIDFPTKNWDDTVREGDSVDLIVRRSFPLFGDELDGIQINDHK